MFNAHDKEILIKSFNSQYKEFIVPVSTIIVMLWGAGVTQW